MQSKTNFTIKIDQQEYNRIRELEKDNYSLSNAFIISLLHKFKSDQAKYKKMKSEIEFHKKQHSDLINALKEFNTARDKLTSYISDYERIQE